MDHDDDNNNGEEEETPEEMVNRSLAEAYDNQQRYMELFHRSAHMLQVLSRFMADPIVVHDLESMDSSDDGDDTCDTSPTSSTSISPDLSSTVANASMSTGVKTPDTLEITLEPIVAFSMTVDPTTMIARYQSNQATRRRPQTCRWRQSSINDSPSIQAIAEEVQNQRLFGILPTHGESMGDNLLRSIISERVEEQEIAAAAVSAAIAVAETVSASAEIEEPPHGGASESEPVLAIGASPSTKASLCDASTTTTTTMSYNNNTIQVGAPPRESSGCGDGSGEGVTSIMDLRQPLKPNGIRALIEAEIKKSNSTCTSASNTDQDRLDIQQAAVVNPPIVDDLPAVNVPTNESNGPQITSVAPVSETGMASRFSVGLATRANIKSAMSEISKAADTIRHARSMLTSMNLGTQMNNNNQETSLPEEGEEVEGDQINGADEESPSRRFPGAQRNIMKFVQPVEHVFQGSDESTSVLHTMNGSQCSSPRPILVRPAPDSKPIIMTKSFPLSTSSQPCDNNNTQISSNAKNHPHSASNSIPSSKNVVTAYIGCNHHNANSPIRIPQHSLNSISKTPNSKSESPSGSETPEKPINTSPVTTQSNPDVNQPSLLELQQRIERKFDKYKMSSNPQANLSIGDFQKALNSAIQNLKKEGVWSDTNFTSVVTDSSKIDKNTFVFPNISIAPKDDKSRSGIPPCVKVSEKTSQPTAAEPKHNGIELSAVVSLRKQFSAFSPCEIRSDVCEYHSEESIETASSLPTDRYAAKKSTSTRCCNVCITPVQPFSDSDIVENDAEVEAICSQDGKCQNEDDETMQGMNGDSSDSVESSKEYYSDEDNDDSIETLVLNQTSAMTNQSTPPLNPKNARQSSINATATTGAAECWTTNKKERNAIKNNTVCVTSATTAIRSGKMTPGADGGSSSTGAKKGGGDAQSSKLSESQSAKEKPAQKPKGGVFRRMTSTIRGWFKKK